MPDLIIVRHGQSVWNLENRFTGDVDVDLTPIGEEEARQAGELLKSMHFDRVFTSVLKRAIRTMEIILKENQVSTPTIVENPALNERRYGVLQGLNKTEMALKYGPDQVLEWRRSFATQPPGGESLKDTVDRVVPYYQNTIEPELRDNKNVLIVAHGNSLRALMMHLENISEEDIVSINLATGVPRRYVFDRDLKPLEISYITKP